MMLAPRSSAERKAASHRPHHVDAGADHRGLVVGGEASADGADRVVGHRLQPGVEDLDDPRAELVGDGEKAFEAAAGGIGARGAAALEAEQPAQAIGVQSDAQHGGLLRVVISGCPHRR